MPSEMMRMVSGKNMILVESGVGVEEDGGGGRSETVGFKMSFVMDARIANGEVNE